MGAGSIAYPSPLRVQIRQSSDAPVQNCGRWLSPAKRLLWEQEIGGSNPPRPTNQSGIRRGGMSERFAAIDRHLEEHLDGWLAELTALCGVPSVSARHEGIQECAVLVSDLLASRGFESEVLPSDGHP